MLAINTMVLGNGTITPDSPYFWRKTPDSPPYIDASNMTLTLAGYNAVCGPQQSWYPDVGPQLSAWVIPVLLLLVNVEVGPFGSITGDSSPSKTLLLLLQAFSCHFCQPQDCSTLAGAGVDHGNTQVLDASYCPLRFTRATARSCIR